MRHSDASTNSLLAPLQGRSRPGRRVAQFYRTVQVQGTQIVYPGRGTAISYEVTWSKMRGHNTPEEKAMALRQRHFNYYRSPATVEAVLPY
jgi:hypothetical protein